MAVQQTPIYIKAATAGLTSAPIVPAQTDNGLSVDPTSNRLLLAAASSSGAGAMTYPVYTSGTEPAAAADSPPFIRVKDPGQPTIVKALVQDSAGAWQWKGIAQSD